MLIVQLVTVVSWLDVVKRRSCGCCTSSSALLLKVQLLCVDLLYRCSTIRTLSNNSFLIGMVVAETDGKQAQGFGVEKFNFGGARKAMTSLHNVTARDWISD